MPKKSTVLLIALIFGFGLLFASCAAVQVKPTAANFKAPKIALEMIEVPQYDGYWYYGGKTKPDKGKAGAHGASLPLAVTFNITNPTGGEDKSTQGHNYDYSRYSYRESFGNRRIQIKGQGDQWMGRLRKMVDTNS